jgi:mannose-6-phosphate isomerase
LDSLRAIAGFRPVKEIQQNIKKLPELKTFVSKELIEMIIECKDDGKIKDLIKQLYNRIMLKSDEINILSQCIEQIYSRLKRKDHLAFEESQFIEKFLGFGADVGLFSFFFFNIIELKPGQAIFTDAGVPHAYLRGNIIECMANSDNVVRAGLTNKFKDVKTLLKIIKYDFHKYNIINFEQKFDEVTYKTEAKEFEISHFAKDSRFKKNLDSGNKPSIYLLTKGSLEILWELEGAEFSEKFNKGESFLIPANLSSYRISTDKNVEFYRVSIPY